MTITCEVRNSDRNIKKWLTQSEVTTKLTLILFQVDGYKDDIS